MGKLFEYRYDPDAKIKSAYSSLLAIAIFSIINVVLLVAKTGTYFLFSAYVPFFLTDLGMYLCGMSPDYYYESANAFEFLPGNFFAIMLGISIAIIVLYLICYWFARKDKLGWLITGLVLFIIDTAALFFLAGLNASFIIDYVFHAWALFSLIRGISNLKKVLNAPTNTVFDEAENGTEGPAPEESM